MFRPVKNASQAGFSFIELIIVTAVTVLIFTALFAAFQSALQLAAVNRSTLTAVSLANERMEFFRSLPYDEVGTLTGIITGPVANGQVLSLNGISFTERIVITYVDGVGDGLGVTDSNGLLNDHKQVKLEYTWDVNGKTQTIDLISTIVPRSVETNAGGGTVRVRVIDSNANLLSGARVQLFNNLTSPPIYEDRLTNVSGEVLLSAVPSASDYEIIVSGPIAGNTYSVDQTYAFSASNPFPVRAPFAVSEGGISTLLFTIDRVSDLTLTVYDDVQYDSVLETFTTSAGIASTTDTTTVSGDALELVSISGSYPTNGIAYLSPITPSGITRWESVRVSAGVSTDTTFSVQFFTGSELTGYVPIPDSDLPGNALGFTDDLIDVTALDAMMYPTTTIGITLQTTDPTETARIDELEIFWRAGSTPASGRDLFVRGEKNIGTRPAPPSSVVTLYKSSSTVNTNSNGQVFLTNLEFDTYVATTSPAYDLARACPADPIVHRAGVNTEVELVYVANAAYTARFLVVDGAGRSIPGATVQLQRPGYDQTQRTDPCGQTFFSGGLSNNNDYTATITVAGYTPVVLSGFVVSEDVYSRVTLTSL